MTLQQTRHEFPFGATTSADELALHPNMKEFFVKHFNAVSECHAAKLCICQALQRS
jgi:hypothetical protein